MVSTIERRSGVRRPEAAEAVVWLVGEEDASTADALRATLRNAAMAGRDVVVDLSAIEFMASATVEVLAEAGVTLAREARSLTLRSPSRPSRRVLELCHLPVDA